MEFSFNVNVVGKHVTTCYHHHNHVGEALYESHNLIMPGQKYQR